MSTSKILQSWYLTNKRELPWRYTKNPYKIWVSEIILQQTRVQQGIQYYYRFLEHFPDLFALARASSDEIMKVWKGLGYYSRAQNMQTAARQIVDQYQGHFPDRYENILRLKGIGPYTAAAISSFAFGEAQPVIDGNVERVLSRLYAIEDDPRSGKGKRQIKEIAMKILDPEAPYIHNQAIMEFGALLCRPQNPACGICPLRSRCQGLAKGMTGTLPLRKKKLPVKNRYFHYLLLTDQNHMFIRKRTGKDIWNTLYDFPLFEGSSQLSLEELLKTGWWSELLQLTGPLYHIRTSRPLIHQLSHQHIHTVFYHFVPENLELKENPTYILCPIKEWKQVAFPRLIERFLEKYSQGNSLFAI